MKILITGATGFIGSHLAESLLQSGNQITCLSKNRLNIDVLSSRGCTVILGDINDGVDWNALLDGVEIVYHVAGVTRCRNAREYYEGNYLATKHIIEVCSSIATNITRLLYVSSLSATGPSFNGRPVDETTPYHPVSHYGKSKMLAEIEVLKASDRLPITIVRPSAVYGPRERDMFDYIKMIKRGIDLHIGFSDKYLSLLFIDDLVRGIQQAAESPTTIGRTYFLGSEQFYRERDLGRTIAHVVSSHPFTLPIPHSLVYCVGAIAAMTGRVLRREVFFNLDKVRESTQHAWTCSVQNAVADFGFCQTIGLEEGMKRSYAWYCANGWI